MGLKAVGVAYKSTPEAMNDMTNGLIDYLFSDATFGLAQAKGGKMRMLAFTSAARSELDPNLPTMQESGVPNLTSPHGGVHGIPQRRRNRLSTRRRNG